MPKPVKPPKPTAPEPKRMADEAPIVWTCAVCGWVTDLAVCPVDGTVAP